MNIHCFITLSNGRMHILCGDHDALMVANEAIFGTITSRAPYHQKCEKCDCAYHHLTKKRAEWRKYGKPAKAKDGIWQNMKPA